MNVSKKALLASILLVGVALISVVSTTSYRNPLLQTRASSKTVELVELLAGKAISDGVVSYTANDYEYKFYASGVTFNEENITIADGGYLKSWTAYNTIQLFDVAGTLDHMILSGGKKATVFNGTDICKDNYYEGTAGLLEGDTHFVIEASGGDVVLTTLDLRYENCTSSGTDTSSGVDYDHYTWKFRGLGTSTNPYLISSLDEWNILVAESQNYIFLDKYFKLIQDITGVTAPVAPTASKRFAGNVDGDGHSITANIEVSVGRSTGLFGYVTSECSISNLTLKGSVKTTHNQNNFGTGGFVGNVFNVSGKYAQFTNLVNEASVTGTCQRAAGIVSWVAGGIRIENCTNKGAISATGSIYAGGIVGIVASGTPTANSDAIYIYGVTNTGTITLHANGTAGGIVGRFGEASYYAEVHYYNAGGYNPVGSDAATSNDGEINIVQLSGSVE